MTATQILDEAIAHARYGDLDHQMRTEDGKYISVEAVMERFNV